MSNYDSIGCPPISPNPKSPKTEKVQTLVILPVYECVKKSMPDISASHKLWNRTTRVESCRYDNNNGYFGVFTWNKLEKLENCYVHIDRRKQGSASRYISVGISLKELGGQILKCLKFCPGIKI